MPRALNPGESWAGATGATTFLPPPGVVPGTPEYDAWLARYSGGGAGMATAGVPNGALAASTNSFMTGQARMPFEINLPQYGANTAQRATNTGSLLKGEVPLDVRNQIMQAGAERGISTGSPGSSNANAAWLRALGITSLGLMKEGSAEFSQEIADTPVPELFNPASLFVPQTLAADQFRYAQQGQAAGAAAAMPRPINSWTTGYADNSARFGRTSGGGLWN